MLRFGFVHPTGDRPNGWVRGSGLLVVTRTLRTGLVVVAPLVALSRLIIAQGCHTIFHTKVIRKSGSDRPDDFISQAEAVWLARPRRGLLWGQHGGRRTGRGVFHERGRGRVRPALAGPL